METHGFNCELSEQEMLTVSGCGSSVHWLASFFRLPGWVSPSFTRCCNFHDIRYQLQYNKQDADWELYNCLYYNAYHSPKWQKYIKIIAADLIFAALQTKISGWCYQNQNILNH